jgi:hypothetical protein
MPYDNDYNKKLARDVDFNNRKYILHCDSTGQGTQNYRAQLSSGLLGRGAGSKPYDMSSEEEEEVGSGGAILGIQGGTVLGGPRAPRSESDRQILSSYSSLGAPLTLSAEVVRSNQEPKEVERAAKSAAAAPPPKEVGSGGTRLGMNDNYRFQTNPITNHKYSALTSAIMPPSGEQYKAGRYVTVRDLGSVGNQFGKHHPRDEYESSSDDESSYEGGMCMTEIGDGGKARRAVKLKANSSAKTQARQKQVDAKRQQKQNENNANKQKRAEATKQKLKENQQKINQQKDVNKQKRTEQKQKNRENTQKESSQKQKNQSKERQQKQKETKQKENKENAQKRTDANKQKSTANKNMNKQKNANVSSANKNKVNSQKQKEMGNRNKENANKQKELKQKGQKEMEAKQKQIKENQQKQNQPPKQKEVKQKEQKAPAPAPAPSTGGPKWLDTANKALDLGMAIVQTINGFNMYSESPEDDFNDTFGDEYGDFEGWDIEDIIAELKRQGMTDEEIQKLLSMSQGELGAKGSQGVSSALKLQNAQAREMGQKNKNTNCMDAFNSVADKNETVQAETRPVRKADSYFGSGIGATVGPRDVRGQQTELKVKSEMNSSSLSGFGRRPPSQAKAPAVVNRPVSAPAKTSVVKQKVNRPITAPKPVAPKPVAPKPVAPRPAPKPVAPRPAPMPMPQPKIQRPVSAPAPVAPQGAKGKPKKQNKRAEIVRQVMQEKGLGLIEASKYVKANGLY